MLVGCFFLYVICVGIGCVFIYQNSKINYISHVDAELLASTQSFNNLIRKNHSENSVKYLYLIEKGSSGKLSKTKLLNEPTHYQELIKTYQLDDDVHSVFLSQTPVFSEVTIKTKPNRLSIIPLEVESGSQPVLVSIKPITYIYKTLNSNLRILLVVFALLFIILFPVNSLLLNTNKKYWMTKIKDSNTDSITGIPNQHQLILDLENTTSPNLAFIKILNYNSFINQYGPAVTDSITKQFATVLSGFEDPRLIKSSIYRVQQSTFAILEDQDLRLSEIADITGKIIKSLLTFDYMVGENEFIKLKVTVGAVKQKKDAYTLTNMALSEAIEKQLPYYFIDSGEQHLPETYKRDLETIKKIRLAIDEDRLVPFFQPIFNAKTLNVEKYESLARIVDENNRPMILPNIFLPLVNRENLNYKITRIILKKSIVFASNNNVKVSINLGVHDINNDQTCEHIYSSIKNSKINHLLQFELLENEAIVDSESALKFIKKIQKLGCEIGMDDLGKGYSNFERLINLPVDFVKIDRCIMEHIADNLEIQNLTKGIIRLAHKKKLKVTAEYCTNKTTTDIAIMLGADTLQGHYFAEASPEIYSQSIALKKTNHK
jgi:EAL domain-containing protein (putative c-di-GMP-specific phosphodiesterase class I)/GGDEF domain-containing protein